MRLSPKKGSILTYNLELHLLDMGHWRSVPLVSKCPN